MAKSRFYDATEDDSRPWAATEIPRTQAINEAAVASAAALEAATHATTTVTSFTVPATVEIDLSDEETYQIPITTDPVSQPGTYSYSSATPAVATVSRDGLVTPVGTGTSVITVTANFDDSQTDTITVTVVA
jgi:hypothetical protein